MWLLNTMVKERRTGGKNKTSAEEQKEQMTFDFSEKKKETVPDGEGGLEVGGNRL